MFTSVALISATARRPCPQIDLRRISDLQTTGLQTEDMNTIHRWNIDHTHIYELNADKWNTHGFDISRKSAHQTRYFAKVPLSNGP